VPVKDKRRQIIIQLGHIIFKTSDAATFLYEQKPFSGTF
jgi:hypothetical protein